MLVLTRKEGETILVYPSLDVDPDMTVADLFRNGPIRIGVGKITPYRAKVFIDAPETLEIVQEELAPNTPASNDPFHIFWP